MNIKRILSGIVFFTAAAFSFSLSPAEEYDLLLNDLMHYDVYGYKETFDNSILRSEGKIDFSQGTLKATSVSSNIAVTGEGYFKVIDSLGKEFYTRYSDVQIDENYNFVIICKNKKYYLPLEKIPYSFVSITIENDGNVNCEYVKDLHSTEVKNLGKIILYKITNENVESYDGYVIKTFYRPSPAQNSLIINGYAETSNVCFDEILIRMLFLYEKLDEEQIKAKEIKKIIVHKLLDSKSENKYPEEIAGTEWKSGDLSYISLKTFVSYLKRDYE